MVILFVDDCTKGTGKLHTVSLTSPVVETLNHLVLGTRCTNDPATHWLTVLHDLLNLNRVKNNILAQYSRISFYTNPLLWLEDALIRYGADISRKKLIRTVTNVVENAENIDLIANFVRSESPCRLLIAADILLMIDQGEPYFAFLQKVKKEIQIDAEKLQNAIKLVESNMDRIKEKCWNNSLSKRILHFAKDISDDKSLDLHRFLLPPK